MLTNNGIIFTVRFYYKSKLLNNKVGIDIVILEVEVTTVSFWLIDKSLTVFAMSMSLLAMNNATNFV